MEPAAGELFKMVVMDEFKSSNRDELDERRNICKLIEEQETMLSNARRKLMKEEIETEDFNIVKKDCNTELRKLEEKLNELPSTSQNLVVESLLEIVADRHTNIDERYDKADIDEKRNIIGSMSPENICFDGTEHRNRKIERAARTCLTDKQQIKTQKKMGKVH